MGGQVVKLGPFKGGLNNISDPAAVADNELVDLVNLEVDFEGALKGRPPIVNLGPHGGVGTGSVRLLGYYVLDSIPYLIGSFDGRTSFWNGQAWNDVTTTFAARVMVQYDNKAWLFPQEGGNAVGGSWTPVQGFLADPDIPKASSAVVYKERIWAAESENSRVRFSAVADGSTWPPNNFFDVNRGDGQNIVSLKTFSNGIYVWKNDSTYSFQFTTAPTEGQVQNISSTIGASGEFCVVDYENYLYVYHEGRVYELVNYNYGEITTKIRFMNKGSVITGFTNAISMTRFKDRILIRYFDQVYAFQLKTRVWSRWESSRDFGPLFAMPQFDNVADVETVYAGSWRTNDPSLYRIQETFNTTNIENFVCYLQTKTYDFGEGAAFKRLFWWGADVVAQRNVRGRVTPIAYSSLYTWDMLQSFTWDALARGTWDQLIDPPLDAITDRNAFGTGNRKFLKFLKGLRFRQVRYELWLDTDGTVGAAPVEVFGLSTAIRQKQLVPKGVN